MSAPAALADLVERFRRNLDEYKNPQYKETRVRVEFVDPLFKLLGWDVHNENHYAEAYKDVIHEDALKVSGGAAAPDYGFRIGGVRKFFVETKKPSVFVKESPEPAYQLRRYAWSAKLPISILTDFEEFAVYDCRRRPSPAEKASVGRIFYTTFDHYPDQWDEIAGTFSKEAVLQGSFDRFISDAKGKRGTSEVDKAFLEEIETWRGDLAKNLALRNPALTVHELNDAVQLTIDRIIFLRMAEDRGMEDYHRLGDLAAETGIYPHLVKLYQQADDRYNSGLFDFKADKMTPRLAVDDKILKPILKNLYYPDCPYEFSVLPADVLGQVYEQFLGKVIRLTSGHQAKVEEKPEVRKAGGVYYTPTYIVDYIVKQTVGKLIENKSPKEIANLRILDPACGSGSFLLGAYQVLLDHHLHWYEANSPEKHAKGKQPPIRQVEGGGWRLTTQEKKRILLNNLYGVDIDRQAVEVTKLSLLLKVLEGENRDTIGETRKLFHERALPDLGKNIQCGNSLIGPDYFADRLIPDEDELRRVNPFDWNAQFPEIMKAGGFDAVIGNPPYVRMEEFQPIKAYLRANYQAHEERADFYTYFLERGVHLLNPFGLMGMIVSNKFSVAKYGRPLRETLAKHAQIVEIADFAGAKVFEGATIRTFVLILGRAQESNVRPIRYVPVPSPSEFGQIASGSLRVTTYAERSAVPLDKKQLGVLPWQLISSGEAELLERLSKDFSSLTTIFRWKPLFGIKTGFNEAFIVDEQTREQLISEDQSSGEVIRPVLMGKDVRRYAVINERRYLIYLHPNRAASDYPAIERHLAVFRRELSNRAASQAWYELQQPSVALLPLLEKPKIVYPIIAPRPRFALDDSGFLINDKLFVLPTDSLYLLGLLNSSLARFFFSSICARLEGSGECYYEFRAQFVERFPVRELDLNKADERKQHDKTVRLVQSMLDAHKKLPAAQTAHDKALLERQTASLDQQIDALVYDLYALTPSEIKIVEGDKA